MGSGSEEWHRTAEAVLAVFEAEGVRTSPPSSAEEWRQLAETVAGRLSPPGACVVARGEPRPDRLARPKVG